MRSIYFVIKLFATGVYFPCERYARITGGKVCITCHNHSALPGRHNLVRVEAEASQIADATNTLSPEFCAVSFSGILDHEKVVGLGQFHQFSHLDRVTEHVYRHYSFRPCRDLLLDQFVGVEFPRQGLDALLQGVALVGEGELGAVGGRRLRDAPGDRAVVGDTEHQAALAGQQTADVIVNRVRVRHVSPEREPWRGD